MPHGPRSQRARHGWQSDHARRAGKVAVSVVGRRREPRTRGDGRSSYRAGSPFATGKRDGSPQQSILGYRFDGTEVVINTGDVTAKVKNIRKNPRVSLAVTE